MEQPTSAPPPPNPPIQSPPPSAPPPGAAPPPNRSGAGWLIVAGITVLVIVAGLWAFLGGMPFHKSQPAASRSGQPLDTIGEGSSNGTVSQIGEPAPLNPVPAPAPTPPPATYDTTGTFATTTTSMPADVGSAPPSTTIAPPPTATYAAPPPRPMPTPMPRPAPPPLPVPVSRPEPPPAPVPQQSSSSDGMLDEQGAIIRLRSFLAQNNPYDVPIRCLDIASLGFSNRGYTMQVTQLACGSAPARTLDRWRVDTLTREVFRQRSDGRFLRP
jgi:hypothetical protein